MDDTKKEPKYFLHSGVRKRHTRQARMRNTIANRAKFVQKVGGGEVIVRRARPVMMTKERLLKHLDEIKEKAAVGLLEVRLGDGRLVDLNSFEARPSAPPKPLPHPLPDSAARDKPIAGHTRPAPEVPAQTEKVGKPTLLDTSLPEGEEPDELDETEELEDEEWDEPNTDAGDDK